MSKENSQNVLNVLNVKDESEDEETNTMTLEDIVTTEEMIQELADEVLGAGDDKHCSFNEGYKKRQALYACLTCTPVSGKERAGICLACSYHCHGDHELIELFTKRNFRCDCGNSLFKGKCCFLDPAKSGVNENNIYGQNFEGIYCTCKRPFPDPEVDREDDMFQCVVCEDWIHKRHLGTSMPTTSYAEMICSGCNDKLPFLQYYLGYSVSTGSDSDERSDISTNINVDDSSPISSPQKKIFQNGASNEKLTLDLNETDGTSTEECSLKSLKMLPRGKGATFWHTNFRKVLCACASCKEMYKRLNVSFLLDEEDTIQAYVKLGEERRRQQQSENETAPSQSDQGLQQILSSMDRVQQIEAVLGYNDLKTNLKEFLAKFAENKKVVREEDIHEFFSEMDARKRRRRDIAHNYR